MDLEGFTQYLKRRVNNHMSSRDLFTRWKHSNKIYLQKEGRLLKRQREKITLFLRESWRRKKLVLCGSE